MRVARIEVLATNLMYSLAGAKGTPALEFSGSQAGLQLSLKLAVAGRTNKMTFN